ncbi:MAG: hypothetical protein JRH20_30940 [Deltaproteobacteria bacterium]|nr:hypothetical protein [Deltaproteobacteria bacterium]
MTHHALILILCCSQLACSTGSPVPSQRPPNAPRVAQPQKRLRPPWYRDISKAKLARDSAEVIRWLEAAGGWGFGRFQIDFSFHVLTADANTPRLEFEPTDDHFQPDCDIEAVPVPPNGALEGEKGYACAHGDDCHLIVYDSVRKRLYEMWRANISAKRFRGGCLAVWDLKRAYGPSGRGLDCTSADAAGLPIAPMLFSADEVQRGEVRHALRFILPNARIRRHVYVAPATHSTGATRGPAGAPPYGARLRLRADYPVDSLPSRGAKVLARTLQRYGMFLADGGNITLTGQSDRFTKAKWKGLLGPHDLRPLKVSDFELVDGGEEIVFGDNCQRNR